jgi:hypothetical protein
LGLASTNDLGFGAHDHIFVFPRLLLVLKWDLIFNERRGLNATGHSPSTRGWVPLLLLIDSNVGLLNMKFFLGNIYNSSSTSQETLHLHYKAQQVNAV